MYRHVRALAALFVSAVCATAASAQDRDRFEDVTVNCESQQGRRTSCPANLEGYKFRDLRQQSSAACEPGRTWGYTERGVWVADGCRADFMFTRDGGGTFAGSGGSSDRTLGSSSSGSVRNDERLVTCESADSRREECPADLRGMRFADVRQLSRTTCEIGRNFGYTDRGVWVEDGCRGEFLFRSAERLTGDPRNDGRSVTDSRGMLVSCESVNDDYTHCDAPGIVSARVADQQSRSDCIEGSSWGVDSRGIWVDRGCRAEFEVFTRLSDSPTRPTRF